MRLPHGRETVLARAGPGNEPGGWIPFSLRWGVTDVTFWGMAKKGQGRDPTKPQRMEGAGEKPAIRSADFPDQPKFRHYGRQPLKRRYGIPVLAGAIPRNVLPRDMIEPLTDNHVRFLVAFWKLGKESEAIAQIGFEKKVISKWRRKPEFLACYDLLRGIVDEEWERKLELSWDEGYEEHEDVYDKVLDEEGEWDGETLRRRRVKTRVKRDPGILKEINRARQPDRYGRPGQGGGGTTINVIFESVDVKQQEVLPSTELMDVEVVDSDQENGDG